MKKAPLNDSELLVGGGKVHVTFPVRMSNARTVASRLTTTAVSPFGLRKTPLPCCTELVDSSQTLVTFVKYAIWVAETEAKVSSSVTGTLFREKNMETKDMFVE